MFKAICYIVMNLLVLSHAYGKVEKEDRVKRATRDTLYFEIGPDYKPTLYVVSGEIFEVETQINRGPWLNSKYIWCSEINRVNLVSNPSV